MSWRGKETRDAKAYPAMSRNYRWALGSGQAAFDLTVTFTGGSFSGFIILDDERGQSGLAGDWRILTFDSGLHLLT